MILLTVASSVVLFTRAPAGEKTKPTVLNAGELKVFNLTNDERKKKELRPLVLSPFLSKLARAHSANMAKQMKMEHKLDDKTPFDRLRDAGYKFAAASENIGMGDEDATIEMIMEAWMASPAHRANILQTEFTEIGVGIARDQKGLIYYTQLFGRPQK